jgi:SAM-dependent methyltransferase
MNLNEKMGFAKRQARAATQLLLSTTRLHQPERRIGDDAQEFWRSGRHASWREDSHWREARLVQGNDLWTEMGCRHLDLMEQGARLLRRDHRTWGRVIDWGCGGGANAVQIAPRAQEFVGVDISPTNLEECERQVAATCNTPFHPLLIDVADPEAAIERVTSPCDVFVSFYVFELLPTPEYGERILRIAHRLLVPGGLALIQITYDTGGWRTRPRRRSYRSNPAAMTSYRLHTFWTLSEQCGLTPRWVHLVPHDEVGERYAYVLLENRASGGGAATS